MFYNRSGEHTFCHSLNWIWINFNWNCDDSNVTTMTLSIGKYDILKMSILQTFTQNYFLTSSSVCSWRHCTPSLWALHFIFYPPQCWLWWWLLVLWDELSPRPGPGHGPNSLNSALGHDTHITYQHSRGNLCYVVTLSLTAESPDKGLLYSPHSIASPSPCVSLFSVSRPIFNCRPLVPGPVSARSSAPWRQLELPRVRYSLLQTLAQLSLSAAGPRPQHRQHSNYFLNRHKIFPRTRHHHGQF